MFKEGQIVKTSKPSFWHLEDDDGGGSKPYPVGTLWKVLDTDGEYSISIKNLLTDEIAIGCPPSYFKEL